ncbi:hypothetical protein DXG01_016877 [Tephrocybe rancida]|nr:hypothetical protein DXG01_016877 [Tephrocybe rancida]
MADWTSDSNEALKLILGELLFSAIFGEDEKLYGYQELEVDLRFASGSLTQYLNVKYAKKLGSTSTVDDVEGTLSGFIPPGMTSFTFTYVYIELKQATWETPGFRELHRRMQLFILLYIEGGSYINEDEDSWEFVILYEKRKRRGSPNSVTYHFVGYSSLYPFYFFPEKTRMRLSQFVILPPYQHRGHGSELYKAIYQYTLSQPNIAELTVEDPAEAFEDLRDRNDLRMLLSNQQFMEEGFGGTSASHGGGRVGGVGRAGKSGRGGKEVVNAKGKMGPPSDKAWLEKWRTDLKIAGDLNEPLVQRQFQRLVEMLILLRLDGIDARSERAYRIQVKERLYRFNFEILAQLEKEERLAKLEETFQNMDGMPNGSFVYDPDQDPEEKRAVRKNYRSLAKTVEDHQSNPNDLTAEQLMKQVRQADLLFDKVKGPQEATLDSHFLLMASSMGAQKARAMKSGSGSFDVDEFVTNLITFMGGQKPLEDHADDNSDVDFVSDATAKLEWAKIGRKALAKSRRVPVMSYMLGPLSIEQKKRAAVKRAKLEKNQEDLRKPQELKEDDISRSQNETTKNVAILESILTEIGGEVNIFQFVINPNDFAQSVENIFYLSFLIRDGKVAFETNEEGEPVVYICEQPTDADYSGGLQKRQKVFEFDMAIWRRAIEVFKIKDSTIPQRPPARTRLGDKWYG